MLLCRVNWASCKDLPHGKASVGGPPQAAIRTCTGNFKIDERNQIHYLISRPHGSSHPVTTRSLEPGDMYTSVFVYTTASVTSATPRADRRSFRLANLTSSS
jgi:hypothetical protein